MTQAIETNLENNKLQAVDEVKRGIIELHEEGFVKNDSSGLAENIYDAIPSNLCSNASRYTLATAKKEREQVQHKNFFLICLAHTLLISLITQIILMVECP